MTQWVNLTQLFVKSRKADRFPGHPWPGMEFGPNGPFPGQVDSGVFRVWHLRDLRGDCGVYVAVTGPTWCLLEGCHVHPAIWPHNYQKIAMSLPLSRKSPYVHGLILEDGFSWVCDFGIAWIMHLLYYGMPSVSSAFHYRQHGNDFFVDFNADNWNSDNSLLIFFIVRMTGDQTIILWLGNEYFWDGHLELDEHYWTINRYFWSRMGLSQLDPNRDCHYSSNSNNSWVKMTPNQQSG